jgi:two-component system nitrate/nitrite response regulator NarL
MDSRRILIVDDHPVVRRGLRAMLESESWVSEVLEAASVTDAIREAVSGDIDLVAMDVTLPDGDGIDAATRLLRLCPKLRVMMLTMSNEDAVVVRAMRAGASGYLLKDTAPETALDAMRTIAGGGFVLGPGVGVRPIAALRDGPIELPEPFNRLSGRERTILGHLARGESNARIARELGVSETTIRNQLTVVFSKLGAADRVQAALLARDAGITS